SRVHCVAFRPDGKLLASGGQHDVIRLWDVATGNQVGQLEGHYGHTASVAFSPDGKTLASGGGDGRVRLWDVDGRKELRHFKETPGRVRCVAFSPAGKWLAAGIGHAAPKDYGVRVWDPATGNEVRRWKLDQGVGSLGFSPDGRTLLARHHDGLLRVWD